MGQGKQFGLRLNWTVIAISCSISQKIFNISLIFFMVSRFMGMTLSGKLKMRSSYLCFESYFVAMGQFVQAKQYMNETMSNSPN